MAKEIDRKVGCFWRGSNPSFWQRPVFLWLCRGKEGETERLVSTQAGMVKKQKEKRGAK